MVHYLQAFGVSEIPELGMSELSGIFNKELTMRKMLLMAAGLIIMGGCIVSCSGKDSTANSPAMESQQSENAPAMQSSSEKQSPKEVYVCVADGVMQNEPGKCPKCGMDLKAVNASDVYFSCPMHPKEVSDKPGKCPECGMFLKMHLKSSEKPM